MRGLKATVIIILLLVLCPAVYSQEERFLKMITSRR